MTGPFTKHKKRWDKRGPEPLTGDELAEWAKLLGVPDKPFRTANMVDQPRDLVQEKYKDIPQDAKAFIAAFKDMLPHKGVWFEKV